MATKKSYLYVPSLAQSNPEITDPAAYCGTLKNLYHEAPALFKEIGRLIQCQKPNQVLVISNDQNGFKQLLSLTEDAVQQEQIDDDVLNISGGPHDERAEKVLAATPPTKLPIPPDWAIQKPKSLNTGPNGCGIWATMVCNRVLGYNKGPATQQEWDTTYRDLGSALGITPLVLINNYYQQKHGLCSYYRVVPGCCTDYAEIRGRIGQHCGVQLYMARKISAWFSLGYPFVSPEPHEETVVYAQGDDQTGQCFATTNSWGRLAKISGGTFSSFSHELNRNFGQNGDLNWQPDGTDLWVNYVCDCNIIGESPLVPEAMLQQIMAE